MQRLRNIYAYLNAKPLIGSAIIAAFYFSGTIGIVLGYGDWFVPKTAFNLLLSFIVLLLYQEHINNKLFIALLACYLIGFIAEFLGVQYGLIFGDYYYPETLGPQIAGVPIVIGINWYLITFVVWSLLAKRNLHPLLKIVLASSAATAIDVLIEPVAIALDFWNWEGGVVPIQNYVGWFIISLIIFSIYQLIKLPTKNKMAFHLLFWQLFFFTILNIYFLW